VNEEQDTDAYDDSPAGRARRWTAELSKSEKERERFVSDGENVLKRYRGEHERRGINDTRWNLFTADVQTMQAMLYGRVPSATVERKFADSGDDVARVASEMAERMLNCDIERDSDSFAMAVRYACSDWLLPGLGAVRLRYVAKMGMSEERAAILDEETGQELAAAVESVEVKESEDVEVDYVHWKDLLFSAGAKVWHEVRWIAFRVEMTRGELEKRFGATGKLVPLNTRKEDGKTSDPWGRADVWEIWDKERKEQVFFVKGFGQTLEANPDPLGLESFFPAPRPMLANTTTSSMIARSDFLIAKDLYDEIDMVSTRITSLERSIRVVGLYSADCGKAVERMMNEACDNELIPVENWAMFAEKGGIKGLMDFLPLQDIVGALTALRDYRGELIEALYQVTGRSDIMRGQASSQGASATEQSAKVKFGSVRVQAKQDEIARFASDALRLKAEIIAKHFDAQTIIDRSNILLTPDAQTAPQAAELLKSRSADYRVEVKPENVSLQDFAALKQERTEVIGALAQYFTAAAPLAQSMPGSAPMLLEILQWLVSGLRGSSQIEGVLDRGIEMARQAAAQPQQQGQPDPKMLAQQMKGEQDLRKVDAELQADIVRAQVEAQSEAQKQAAQTRYNLQEALGREHILAMRPPGQGEGLGGPGGKP